jgi:hypothetical protein
MTDAYRVPGGVGLTADEQVLVGVNFMYSTVAFYLKTELALTNRRFIASRPNTLFGLVPVGTRRSSYPIESIAGVSAGSRFDLLGVIFGVLAIVAGIVTVAIPNARVLSLLLILLGAAGLFGAPEQYVEVMNSGGGTFQFPVSVFERGRTFEFAAHVSEAMARAPRPGPAGVTAQGMSPAVAPDPSLALRQLESLRGEGLLTEEEYATKRREVLARL